MKLAELEDLCGPTLSGAMNADLFKALGDPVRLALVGRLAMADGSLTVTEASSCCGVHLSGVSRHLTQLRRAGVLRAEKHGREVRYELDREALASALRGLADAVERGKNGCCPQK